MDEQHNEEEIATSPSAPRNDAEQKAQEYLAGWKRAQADYQNLKKETEREKIEFAKYANERLLAELLTAFDQFNLALAHIPDTASLPESERKKWDNWLTGIKAVKSLWEQAATQAGLEQIPTEGAFDPNLHEAVSEEEGGDPGTIKTVLQVGWRLHGKVLRPSKVIISK